MTQEEIMRVLVVDDYAPLRRMMPRLLAAFDVVAAGDAIDALALLAKHPFDVVVTDYGMPTYSGLQLLLDVAGAYPTVRRVLMTGLPRRRFKEHVASRLVHSVLTKPFNRIDLRRAIGAPTVEADVNDSSR